MVKETIMVIKVDLQCCRCYKKIKKILCNFPEIRDQVYDEKNNTVTITVVCCSPEKIKQKICCKGGDTIKCIEIKEPTKPQKKPNTEPTKPTKPDVPGCPPAPKAFVPVLIPIGCPPANSIGVCCRVCCGCRPGGPCVRGHCSCRPASPPHNPIRDCCDDCRGGRPGGPCFRGLEGCERRICDSWGGGGCAGYYPSRCDYFCEENPSSCTIM